MRDQHAVLSAVQNVVSASHQQSQKAACPSQQGTSGANVSHVRVPPAQLIEDWEVVDGEALNADKDF